MNGTSTQLHYLLLAWGVVTAVLVILVIYGSTLSIREDDQFHLNKAEEIMASDQQVLLGKMTRLHRIVVALSVASGILLIASAGMWAWIGFNKP